MKIFHVHCQPDMLLELILHHFPTPKIFDWLQQQGNIETNEMYNIFNMGIGYTVIVDEKDVSRALKILAEQNVEAYQIGHIVKNESTAIELLGV